MCVCVRVCEFDVMTKIFDPFHNYMVLLVVSDKTADRSKMVQFICNLKRIFFFFVLNLSYQFSA